MIETVKATGTVKPPERAKSALIADTFWDMEKTYNHSECLAEEGVRVA